MNRENLEIEEIYPLSSLQEGMLFHAEMDKNSNMYFEQIEYVIKGDLNIGIFEKSLQKLVDEYSVLRTIFIYKNVERISQVVLKHREITINYQEISNLSKDEKDVAITKFKEKDKSQGFCLSKDRLLRIAVFKIEKDLYTVIWSFHHIIMDGWCLGIINKRLLEIYSEIKNNKISHQKQIPKYKTYIQWIQKQDKKKAQEYWKGFMGDYDNKTIIPFGDINRKAENNINEVTYVLSKPIISKLKKVSNKYGVTFYTIFETIWGILLLKYNNTRNVIFGAVTSGRPAEIPQIEEMVGLFINTLPVKISYEEESTFIDMINKLQVSNLESEQYSYFPLQEIQNFSPLGRQLLNHILVFENYPMEKLLEDSDFIGDSGLCINDTKTFEQTNFNLNIIIVPGKEFKLIFKYNADIFNSLQMETIYQHMSSVFNQILEYPNIKIKNISVISDEEKSKLMYVFNKTENNYYQTDTLVKLFEKQVKETPNKIALSFEGKEITYDKLNKYSNKLAYTLVKHGIKQNSIVGLLFERSFEMIISILAILKAGGGYLPIDPSFPKERIINIFKDANGLFMLTQDLTAQSIFGNPIEDNRQRDFERIQIIFMEQEEFRAEYLLDLNEISYDKNLDICIDTKDLAYIIYTSGSTGMPKGTLITHRNVLRIIKNTNYITIGGNDNVLQLSNYAFDGSVFDIFGALTNGAKLILIKKETLLDPYKLRNIAFEQHVSVLFITTALFNTLIDFDEKCFVNTRHVLFGGEKASVPHVKRAFRQMGQGKLIHMYGPTESAVFATYYSINEIETDAESIPIGKPITDTIVYIMDLDGNLQPIGVPGEIVISGNGISKGYLNKDETTKERFKPNPHNSNMLLYYTGDIAKWNAKGELEFVGRKDNQIKLRGFRIELEEIEANLLCCKQIQEAVVLMESINGSQCLCAYYLSKESIEFEEIRNLLARSLPDYMIPSFYCRVEKMPLTFNGKIDKDSLRKKNKVNLNQNRVAPRNKTEALLVGTWEKVLKISPIGIYDNYFSLGGDSIKAIQIASQLHKEKMVMEISDLFSNPTIAALSLLIKETQLQEQESVEGEIGLTPIQNWFFNENRIDLHYFNHSIFLKGRNCFDINFVRKIFEELIKYHDVLRMTYEINGNKVVQFNQGYSEKLVSINDFDLRNHDNLQEAMTKIANKMQSSFDLKEGPLLKVGIFRTVFGDYLFIIAHHLIIDGVSWRILLEDFCVLYKSFLENDNVSLQSKTSSYKEWSTELMNYSKSEILKKEKEYWLEIVNTDIMVLPVDYEIQTDKIKESTEIQISLTQEETVCLLRQVNQTYNTEINDLLISALALAVNQWTNAKKVLISLEGHGRDSFAENINVNHTVGWFTSKYPVLIELQNPYDIGDTIKSTKNTLKRIPCNGIGYGILKYLTQDKEDIEYQDKAEISFNYLGQLDQDLKTDLFEPSEYSGGNSVSGEFERKYKLDMNGYVKDGKLIIYLNYNLKQYDKQTMEQFMENYKENLKLIIDHCLSKAESELTATDFEYKDMSEEQLSGLISDLEINLN